MNTKEKGILEMIVGLAGALLSLIVGVWSIRSRRYILALLSAISFLVFLFCFYTGWKNYAGVMLGVTKIPYGMTQLAQIEAEKIPLIEIKNTEELSQLMSDYGKSWLWLPCAKGGAWYKQSAFFITKFNLPKEDVVCPSGRPLIHFTK